MTQIALFGVLFFVERSETVNRILKEQLKDWKQQHQEAKQRRKPQKRRAEKLMEFELKSLMDVNRPTYRRYRGSFRQR